MYMLQAVSIMVRVGASGAAARGSGVGVRRTAIDAAIMFEVYSQLLTSGRYENDPSIKVSRTACQLLLPAKAAAPVRL